ncbi:MAG: FG-GAP-like repeat-containing protein [Rubripirellula sp.]
MNCDVTSQGRWSRLWTMISVLLFILCVGCNPPESPEDSSGTKYPLSTMRALASRGQFDEAWTHAEQVAEKYSDDPEILAQVAQLAHNAGKPEHAADYLVLACVAENYDQPQRVQQAMIALVGVGKLFQGLDLLRSAIDEHPDQHESRRWLFDLLMGCEDRQGGLQHGRRLIRDRQFDIELLKALANTEYRTMEVKPLLQMTERFPEDTRPLLGDARQKFDQRDFNGAAEVLQSIIDRFPDYAPAQGLLGRVLAGNENWKSLEKWASTVTSEVAGYPEYWLALGDWARNENDFEKAARCYWEATRIDGELAEPWTKLSLALRQAEGISEQPQASVANKNRLITPSLVAAINGRSEMLSQLNQQRQKFERSGSVSRETAIEIAKTLNALGRKWEAEAWCSVALLLPEDDSVPVQEFRNEILQQLTRETPWQISDLYDELRADLTHLAMPSINRFQTAAKKKVSQSTSAMSAQPKFVLRDEAQERSLTFFGRTSDTLSEPGIMLYQTLGCGGGTLDFDLDGWSDLYLAAAGGTPNSRDSASNALYRNQVGSFHNFTNESDTVDHGFAQGIAVGDVNEDGFPDILILNYGPNVLMTNNGDGTFSDTSDQLSSNMPEWSTSGAIADLDGDGLSDLVVLNYCAGMEPVTVTCPMPDSELFRSCSPMKFSASSDVFYHANERGELIDMSEMWNGKPTITGRGLGLVIGSLDESPGNDVFIANDMTNNHFWTLSKNSETDHPEYQLIESAMLRGLGADDRAIPQGSMGIASADFDQNGTLDFYVTNFDKEYNTLHQNQSAGIWRDVTSKLELAAPSMPLVGFGTEANDLNGDGKLELLVTNGHVDMFSRGNEKSLYEHPFQIFEQTDKQTYQSANIDKSESYLEQPHVGRALWTIDANGDHLSDFVITHQTEPVALLINHTAQQGSFLELELIGTTSSRDAIGTVIQVQTESRTHSNWLIAGDGYLCSNEKKVRFSLGPDDPTCDILIRWPTGLTQEFRGLEINRAHQIIEAYPETFSH